MKRITRFRLLVPILTVAMIAVSGSAFAAPDVSLTADGKVPGGPFVYLQEQIDNIQLIPGPQGPAGPIGPPGVPGDQAALTPPVVTHDAPATISAYELAQIGGVLSINITVTDDAEVAYYVVTDYSQPANNGWFVVDSGQTAVTFTLENSSLQNGLNSFMIMAADMQGSISKLLIEVDADVVDCSNRVPGANLIGCNFDGLRLDSINLSGANLTLASMNATQLTGANLSNATLVDASFRSANLYQANLDNADLSGAYLYFANLREAILTNAVLQQADLSQSYMHNGNFSNADLSAADLRYAVLFEANFSNADLSLVDATGVRMSHTNLSGANLTGAQFDWFGPYTIWSNTTCPDGTNSDTDDGDGLTCNNNLLP